MLQTESNVPGKNMWNNIRHRIEIQFAPRVCKSQDFFNTFILIYPYLYTVV